MSIDASSSERLAGESRRCAEGPDRARARAAMVYRPFSPRAFTLILATGLVLGSACGDDSATTPASGTDASVVDTGPDSAMATSDMGIESDLGMPVDQGAMDLGGVEDMGADDMASDADGTDSGMNSAPSLADYLSCVDDVDCPVGLGECVKTVGLNRPDVDGTTTVSIQTLFPDIPDGEGVCSRDCTQDESACDTLSLRSAAGVSVPFTCQLIAEGAANYPDPAPAFPFDDQLDEAALAAGPSFGAVCRPPFELNAAHSEDFCAECTATQGCSGGSVCWRFATELPATGSETGVCLEPVSASGCPGGFEARPLSDDGSNALGDFCVPIAETCGACRDQDADGRGVGHCTTAGSDCDDTAPNAYYDPNALDHPFPAACGDHDYNCDGRRDDVQQIGSDEFGDAHCTACDDPCSGMTTNGALACVTTNGTPACVSVCVAGTADCTSAPGCETSTSDTTNLYYEDLDGDGFGDPQTEAFYCDATAAAAAMTRPVQDDQDCDDAAPESYPGAQEVCDGKDNNCDTYDDAAPQMAAPIQGVGDSCSTGQLGLCSVGAQKCDASTGTWELTCEQTYQPTEETCNSDFLDNDCDGVIDSLDPDATDGTNIVGDACLTTTVKPSLDGSVNACAPSTWECQPTVFNQFLSLMFCLQKITPVNEAPGFDGIDSNCDGHDRYYDEANDRPYAVFVEPLQTGNGLPNSPFGASQMQQAIDAAANCSVPNPDGLPIKCDVYLRSGQYSVPTQLNLRPGVSIYGGFALMSSWSDTNARTTSPTGNPDSTILSFTDPASGPFIGIIGADVPDGSPTHLDRFSVRTVQSGAVRSDGHGNFAMALLNASGVSLGRIALQAGDAGDGTDGTPGSDGQVVPDNPYIFSEDSVGAPPDISREYSAGSPLFGSCGEFNAAYGGLNGNGFTGFDFLYAAPKNIGLQGGAGWPDTTLGGQGGVGSQPTAPNGGRTAAWTMSGDGDGEGGRSVANTDPQGDWGTLNLPAMEWIGDNGPEGRRNGGGGGGGGGAYTAQQYIVGGFVPHYRAVSRSGPHGGCPGYGGSGGRGGGVSVGLFLYQTNLNVAEGLELRSGSGGDGGNGGNGGDGSSGRDGAVEALGTATTLTGHGGHGAGGNGGDGGVGGSSITLWLNGSGLSGAAPTYAPGSSGIGGQGGVAGAAGGVGATTQCVDDTTITCAGREADDGNSGRTGADGVSCNTLNSSSLSGARPGCS